MKVVSTAFWISAAAILNSFSQESSKIEDISATLKSFLETKGEKLPSVAAAVIVDGELRAAGAAGLRKKGDPATVTVEDRFHIGLCTKSMTATLAAALVEEEKISWDSQLGDVLGDIEMKDEWKKATLLQMLSHTAGFPHNPPPDIWTAAWFTKGSPERQWAVFLGFLLQRDPSHPPGTRHDYSNAGYTAAAMMLEKVSGKSWETLMQERLFEPLGMESAGFREPASEGEVDQPWGHYSASGNPQPPGPKADNPNAIAPAGAVHLSIADFARYVQMHLLRETGPVLKEPETFEKLHTIVAENYALGWVVLDRKWAGGTALMHGGSNAMFATTMWLAPKKKFAVVTATNIGVGAAGKPLDDLAGVLIEKFLSIVPHKAR